MAPSPDNFYDREAESQAARYESRSCEEIHGDILDLTADKPDLVLDIGAGSGRDPAWFAAQGREVIQMVQPSSDL